MRVHGNKLRTVMTVPHSGFGIFGPQIITGKGYPAEGATEIDLHARPSIAKIILLCALLCGSLISVVLLLLKKCSPIFCLLITVLAMIRLLIAAWETRTCLTQFSRRLTEKFT